MRKSNFVCMLMSLLLISSCKKDDNNLKNPGKDNDEQELITTMVLTFTEENTTNTSTFIFRDADGEGGNKPQRFDTIKLNVGVKYNMAIAVLDESAIPTDTITHEIEERAEEHLFCFTSTAQVDITTTDKDMNNLSIGLTSTWTAHNMVGRGTVIIALKHQPDVKDGSCNLGATDIELPFVVDVN